MIVLPYWPFVSGIHPSLVVSPREGKIIWTVFLCHDVIMNVGVHLFQLFIPQPKLGSRGIVVIRRAGGRAWPQHRYRSHGRSCYPIAVKLGRDEPWGRTSDEFVLVDKWFGLWYSSGHLWFIVSTLSWQYYQPNGKMLWKKLITALGV